MRAAVLHAVNDLRIEDIPTPEPGVDEVLVRVRSSGICGSDVPRVFRSGTYRFPTVCGHEFAGTVERGGDLAPGTPVTVFPLLWCGRCSACELGEYARCADYGYLGSRSDGGFAEYVVAPRRNLLPLPDGVSLDEGAMTEPAAVALHALRRGRLGAGETVAVVGAGPIGLMVAQWARALGAAKVLILDVAAPSLALARTLGFEHCCDLRGEAAQAWIAARTGGRGAEVTLDAAGVPAAVLAAVEATAAGGRVVLLGNPSAEVVLPPALISRIMRRELTLVGTWNSTFSACGLPDDWRTTLAAVAAGSIRLAPLISHRLPLERTLEGLNLLRERREFVAKVMISP